MTEPKKGLLDEVDEMTKKRGQAAKKAEKKPAKDKKSTDLDLDKIW